MTALIFLFMLINFADKVVVGLAAQPIMADLHLTPEQFGLIGSSFFFLFALSAVIVGFITNHVPTRHTLLVMAIVWSLVQFPMLGTVSLEVLIACRIILGAGEGPAAPVATHAIYKWFPDSLRGLPTAIIAQGSALGVIVAVPALNWIIVNYSWHWAFGALGIVGLLWAVLWLIFGREGTLVDPPVRHGAWRRRARALPLPADLPQHRGRLLRGLRQLLGPGAGPHLVHVVPGGRPGLQPGAGRQPQHPALGPGHVRGAGRRLHLAAPEESRRLEPPQPRRLRLRHRDPGRRILPFVGSMPTPELKLALLVVGRRHRQHDLCRPADDRERAHAAAAARRHARHHHFGGDPGRRAGAAGHGRDGAERRHADGRLRARLCRPGRPADRGRPHRPALHPARSTTASGWRHTPSPCRRCRPPPSDPNDPDAKEDRMSSSFGRRPLLAALPVAPC